MTERIGGVITVCNEVELDEALRAKKLKRKEIGEEVGITQATLRRYLADDNGEKKQTRLMISIKRCLSRHNIEMVYGGQK